MEGEERVPVWFSRYRCMSRGLISAAVQSSCGREGVGCGAREDGWAVKDSWKNGRMHKVDGPQ